MSNPARSASVRWIPLDKTGGSCADRHQNPFPLLVAPRRTHYIDRRPIYSGPLCRERGAMNESSRSTAPRPSANGRLSKAMEDLYAMSEAELPTYDIAELSLLAARGLPGADDLHVERYLSVLNLWARRIQTQTNKHGGVFRSDPGKFDNSEGFWRMLALTATLRDEFNIRYNMERIEKEDWSDSRDGLIHGLLGPNRTGTCSSLPVLLVAIGRRLGYPLFLVCTIGHLFVRWSSADKNERFNVEFNGDGMSRHPDQYYREWPAK